MESDDYYDNDYDDEEDVVAPVPSQSVPAKEDAPPKKPIRSIEALLAGGPDEWFGSWWKKRAKLMPQFKDALVNFRPIQIRNFLAPEAALALHQELYGSKDFEVYEAYHRCVVVSLWQQFFLRERQLDRCSSRNLSTGGTSFISRQFISRIGSILQTCCSTKSLRSWTYLM